MEEESIFSLENLWLAKLLQKIIQEEFIFTKTIISGGQDIFTQASLDNTNVFLQHLLHSFNEFLNFITSANHSRRATQASLGLTNAFLPHLLHSFNEFLM